MEKRSDHIYISTFVDSEAGGDGGGSELVQEVGGSKPVGHGWRWAQNFETGECRGREYS